MINEIDLLKAQSEALGAYLKLQEGLLLRHGHCLNATAATHGHSDWHVVSAAGRSAPANQNTAIKSRCHAEVLAARLGKHLLQRYGFRLTDTTEAIAAMRWGELIEQANERLGDPLAASNWLRQSHPGLGNMSPFELIETDAGYEQIERLLLQVPKDGERTAALERVRDWCADQLELTSAGTVEVQVRSATPAVRTDEGTAAAAAVGA